jgi:hypothetical protein
VDPVFHGVILYYVVGIDFDGVMRRKAVDGGSGGGVGIGVGGCGEWGGDPVDYVGLGVCDERVFCFLLLGQHQLCGGQSHRGVKESLPGELAQSADTVTGVIRVVLGEWVDARVRNRKWCWTGVMTR